MIVELMPDEVLARLKGPAPPRIVDVRTPMEYAGRHIPGALLMPIDEFAARVQELDPEEELVLVCEHGIRSASAASYLAELAEGGSSYNFIRFGTLGPVSIRNHRDRGP